MKLVFAMLLAVAHANDEGTLTEETFTKEVFGSGKNSFIKFLAPW